MVVKRRKPAPLAVQIKNDRPPGPSYHISAPSNGVANMALARPILTKPEGSQGLHTTCSSWNAAVLYRETLLQSAA